MLFGSSSVQCTGRFEAAWGELIIAVSAWATWAFPTERRMQVCLSCLMVEVDAGTALSSIRAASILAFSARHSHQKDRRG
jgi:hypothetical protein